MSCRIFPLTSQRGIKKWYELKSFAIRISLIFITHIVLISFYFCMDLSHICHGFFYFKEQKKNSLVNFFFLQIKCIANIFFVYAKFLNQCILRSLDPWDQGCRNFFPQRPNMKIYQSHRPNIVMFYTKYKY